MSDRPLLTTTTGEPFQPARLHYCVRDRPRLESCFHKLRCMGFDEDRNRWVWHYNDEARSLKFEHSWKEVSKIGTAVLGSFYLRGDDAAELYVRSIQRALLAVTFFDAHVPRTVARVTDIDVANRLFSADQLDVTPEAVFAAAEADLRRQVEDRQALLADPMKLLADFNGSYSGGQRKQLPELERFSTNFYDDGIDHLTHTLRLRQRLAMEHWLGNRDLTLFDLIRQGVAGVASERNDSPGEFEDRPLRINWNFGPEVPVRDFFEPLDLSCPHDLSEAVENFIYAMETDRFRTWEAVIREEQELVTMPVLFDLAAELMSFDDPDEDDPVHYINGIERCGQPWYEILRRLAPRLLIERLRTADVHAEFLLNGWPCIATWVERRGRGLSLPEGIRQPLDVVPEELRRRLWIQFCCEALRGLEHSEEMTLADDDQHWRVAEFLDRLRRRRDGVELAGLTLDGVLQRCELPDRDRPIFIRMVSERLGLSGTGELLAPKLETAGRRQPEEPGEPIARQSEEDIRQAILHPEPAVHRAAMWYFAGADSRDPAIAPLVIESMQAMQDDRGRALACNCLKRLVLTGETCGRILQELETARTAGDDAGLHYRYAVASSLLAGDPSFLAGNEQSILAALPEPDPMPRDELKVRISDGGLGVGDRWAMFLRLIDGDELFDQGDDFYPRPRFIERVECLIRGMGDDGRPARWVIETLPLTINDEDYSSGRELIAVNLAGVLRLEEAVPYLIALLHDDDPEMVEQAVRALTRIGSDIVIEALDRWYADAGKHFRLQAAKVLQHIHSDRSTGTLQKWSGEAERESEACRVWQALLEQFVTSEIERTRRWMIDADPLCHDVDALRRALVAASLAAGRDFPELNDWLAAVREDMASEPFPQDLPDHDELWMEEDEDWDEDDRDEFGEGWDDDSGWSGEPFPLSGLGRVAGVAQAERGLRPMDEDRIAPITHGGPKIGRNDPCPCGSGKKYKKCCLKKQ